MNYNCRFCGKELKTKHSKCFNTYCRGQEFSVHNFVYYRLNDELGYGKIIKEIEIPVSKKLDDVDSFFITKYKVRFENNIVKIIHPIDLIHKIFEVNDEILTNSGRAIVNSSQFEIQDGILSYEVIYSNGNRDQVLESEIKTELKPRAKEIIKFGELSTPKEFLLKYWAHLFYSYYSSYQIKCITNSRLTLMPHQINVTHRLSEEYFPRVILADEVGLGKTIEAGIYLKEMIARNIAERILIIVPATLVRQWKFEMRNKFNLQFKIYDGKKIKKLKKKTKTNPVVLKNPFYYDNLIICSLQFARNRKYINLLSQISWDIVIFDEAHHLRRYLLNASTGNYRETLNYTLARNLSQNCESLLLLTATPLQLHSFELFSLIELIHPEAFNNFSDFEHFRKNMPFISLLRKNINQLEKLNTFELKNTIKLLKNLEYVDKNDSTQKIIKQIENKSFKSNLIKKIEKDHTLSKYLIRNRKKNVFTDEIINNRIVKTIMVHPKPEELDLYNEIRLYLAKIYNSAIDSKNTGLGFVITTLQKLLTSSKHAFLKSIERRLEEITRLKDLNKQLELIEENEPEYFESELEDEFIDNGHGGEYPLQANKDNQKTSINLLNREKVLKEFRTKLTSLKYDSKAQSLIDLLNKVHQNNPEEKILLFTQFVDTLTYLKRTIESLSDEYYVETFYGQMDKGQKAQAVKRFRDSDKFSILLSTEIGGEGRNFQFCRVLINYDLPWNPMKLEQRIGRLDRIGQASQNIYIYNFFMEGTIETDIVFALNKRIDLFEESIGVLEPIIGKIEKDFRNLIFSEQTEKRKNLNQFYRNLDEQIKKARELEMQLDDLLIDEKSFQMDGLMSYYATCNDVKLTHNEILLFTEYFLGLENQKYGTIQHPKLSSDLENHLSDEKTKITLKDAFLERVRFQVPREYEGTFNLELAKQKEEIDFFALGHPLIDEIIHFCLDAEFQGRFTRFVLNKDKSNGDINKKNKNLKHLYLFVFNVKFQGFIVEYQIIPVLIDSQGNQYNDLADLILDIEDGFELICFPNKNTKNNKYDANLVNNLRKRAKNMVKTKTSIWKKEIIRLNDKIVSKELKKKRKLHEYKQNVLILKLQNQKQKLEKKISQRPTERQMRNINTLTDEEKKQERLEKAERLEENIRFIEKTIGKLVREIEDLQFEYEDQTNIIKRRNLAKFYTNLISFAIIDL
ncbi:MAG: hypothetical protein GF383_00805 [Candidatus Lokiarchaeota archaeon]|nr:hypothetical protein [Candidatus Lokiarchaeota archaeon]MBD3337725.1 hypothetical protein [Candidatus Lokiarchaeota archaeon]